MIGPEPDQPLDKTDLGAERGGDANPRLFEKIEMYGIETPIETVCERAVAFAREASGVRGA